MSTDRPFEQVMADLRRSDPAAAREVFDRYARRLVGLAAVRLPVSARRKVDPEDVAQSVFRTFFRRAEGGQFTPNHWDALWSLLAVLTARKCGHKVDHILAARRDARREVPDPAAADASTASNWDAPGTEPAPDEAIMLKETLELVLEGLHDRERPVVVLRLQGYTTAEISREVGRSERTVQRILDGVRDRLTDLARGG